MSSPAVTIWKKAPFIRILLCLASGILLQWSLRFPILLWVSFLLIGLIVFTGFFFLSIFKRYQWSALNGLSVNASTIKIGNSALELNDADGVYQPMPGMFYFYVEDADSIYTRAIECGAEAISAPVDHDYGDRSGCVKDVSGNTWYIATRLQT